MSKFYGTLQGARGEATRQGHSSIRASAQSWDGSIIVELSELDGETMYEIRVGKGSTAYGDKTIAQGKLSDLLNINTLKDLPDADGRTPALLYRSM